MYCIPHRHTYICIYIYICMYNLISIHMNNLTYDYNIKC